MLTAEETFRYLDSFTNYERSGLKGASRSFNLDKPREALGRLGNPQLEYRSVHIAGTKGKGSVSTFVASILKEAGYTVGLYTSPHVDTPLERIKINDKNITWKEIADIIRNLKKNLGQDLRKNFTFFEIYTIIAILYFSMKKADYAVFETGVGGRLDATNVIDAEVCGITPISYDHTQTLGERIGEIAREKAAIIKNAAWCVSSPQREEALNVIKKRCFKTNTALAIVGEDIEYDIVKLSALYSRFNIRSESGNVYMCRTGLLGAFQASNCATAVGICEKLLGEVKTLPVAVKKAVSEAYIPARLEILSRRPLLVIDGAQNEASTEALKYSLERIFDYERLILILGMMADKDVKGVCRQLAGMADDIILTKASCPRAMDPGLIKGFMKGGSIRITSDVREALGTAFSSAKKRDMILVAGSLYLAGEARRLIQKNEPKY